ncbi:excinuclease ABC subunit UvrC [Gloeocapsa sp. PCC 73106]|uniref:excinuclease ABC subunit UvrC n=1 Tax=Gloeocapsa sp. PCC 73106 TaxID=102232 RepID=UPI0002ABA140|nr:excinuclease ABC subunit UvrC [Gloeocapsa sp. PCC 73106]ELR97678.1 Excinuclease ABC subunit C [Gloeocapsa sp. PCC 73106]
MKQEKEQLDNLLSQIPTEPGIYFMKGKSGDILYIGKSKQLRSRVRSYFRDAPVLSPRITLMVNLISDIEFIVTDNEAEALALEANLIKEHQPHFNVLLKDDKKYPYICITWSEAYPRIFLTRKRKLGKPKDRYYGPFVDVRQLRQTLDLIKRLFPLRQRPKPLFSERPCLNYDLGRCPGVCQELITPEAYRDTMEKVAMIFQGRTTDLQQMLREQMEKASLNLEFEKAALLRDQINGLNSLFGSQKVALSDDTISRDAIALASDDQHCCIQLFQIRGGHLVNRLGFFTDGISSTEGAILQRVLEEHYLQVEGIEIPNEILIQHPLPEVEMLSDWLSQRKGRKVTISLPLRQAKAELIAMVAKNAAYDLAQNQEKKQQNTQALADLAQILHLSQLPHRIEGYDISHLQGSNPVASQVVFIDGIPAKQHYRHYKIKNPEIKIGHSDDFASLAEVIGRRFRNSTDKPDLIMIDGGKGQLSSVMKILEEMDLASELTVVSLAKQKEEIFLPHQSQPLLTNPEQPGVQLLRRLRDEAHRFAVTFHRQLRLKQNRRSRLDAIPGLGNYRQQQLLAHFHSLDYIREASVTQLAQVSGIGEQLAQTIYDYFHGD